MLHWGDRDQTQGGCVTWNLVTAWWRGGKYTERLKNLKSCESVDKYWGTHELKLHMAGKEWSGGSCMLNNIHTEFGGIQVLISKC